MKIVVKLSIFIFITGYVFAISQPTHAHWAGEADIKCIVTEVLSTSENEIIFKATFFEYQRNSGSHLYNPNRFYYKGLDSQDITVGDILHIKVASDNKYGVDVKQCEIILDVIEPITPSMADEMPSKKNESGHESLDFISASIGFIFGLLAVIAVIKIIKLKKHS